MGRAPGRCDRGPQGRRGDRLSATAPDLTGPALGPAPRVLHTDRLELRAWEPADRDAHRAMSRSEGFFLYPFGPDGLPVEAVDAGFDRKVAAWEQVGYGRYAVRERGRDVVLGDVGLVWAAFVPDLLPAVDFGWRFAPEGRGRGLATEAARAVARMAFDELGLDRLLVVIEEANVASMRVAQKLGDAPTFRHEATFLVPGTSEARPTPVLGRWVLPRHLARAEVVAFTPVDGDQAAAKARILGLLDDPALAEADLLGRDDAGHLTGSAVVVDAAGERALLLWHKKVGAWLQPGGHLDGDFDLARSALREAKEETGIEGLVMLPGGPVDLDVHRVGFGSNGPHDHHDVRYVVVAPLGAEPVANEEADRFRWVTAAEAEVAGDIDPGTRRLVLHALGRGRSLL